MTFDPASVAAAVAIAGAALNPNAEPTPDPVQFINDTAATITEHAAALPEPARGLVATAVNEYATSAIALVHNTETDTRVVVPAPEPTPPTPPAALTAPAAAAPAVPAWSSVPPTTVSAYDAADVPSVARSTALGSANYSVLLDYPTSSVAPAGIEFASLSPRNLDIARVIIDEGRRMGISDRGIQIALAVGFTESGLRNLANPAVPASLAFANDGLGYDHDSVNPFQQRQSWGTTAELMDPATAARKFYSALLKVGGWERMPLTVAAQTVQVSAFPDRYGAFEAIAGEVLTRLSADRALGAR
ncbi:hypothetical protein GS504_01260 [Rhodococcus hoagii]|nr:hypothetical protein [Prescottella equi]NKS71698.1 hypothetical protein [Prescottella equi]